MKAHGVFTLIANTDHRNVIKDSPTLHVARLALWEDELPASHTARPMPCRRLSWSTPRTQVFAPPFSRLLGRLLTHS